MLLNIAYLDLIKNVLHGAIYADTVPLFDYLFNSVPIFFKLHVCTPLPVRPESKSLETGQDDGLSGALPIQ